MGPSAISRRIVRDFASKVAEPGSRAIEHNLKAGLTSIGEAAGTVRLLRGGA